MTEHTTYVTSDGCSFGSIPADWAKVTLGDIALEFFSGGTPSTSTPDYWNGEIGWTTSAHLQGFYFCDAPKAISLEGLAGSSSKVVPEGNLLVGTRVGVGKVALNLIAVAISQDLTAAIIDRDQADPEFVGRALLSNSAQHAFRVRSRGTTIKGIARKDLLRIPIPLPKLPEQRRIAHVLRTIDQAIAAQEQVIAAARELKRSLMQRLFTYGPGPEPAPTKDTEIGPVPEHWEVVRLGELLQTTQYGLSTRAGATGAYPMLRMNNLIEGLVDVSDLKHVDLPQEDFAKFRLYKRDVLFNRTNSYELVGKTSIFDIDGEFVFASYLIRVVPDSTQLLPEYLNYYLNWENALQRLRMLATRGVSQSNISATKLKQFEIGLPSVSTQTEIAESLSAVDGRIRTEEQRKATLQALFQSMLQQLMTGQIRV